MHKGSLRGFTLIELSIVLVVIGLLVGGILVGRDLIKTAEVRATIAQVEKYNTAAATFQGKFGYLPGDFPEPDALRFGFHQTWYGCNGSGKGYRDGNGLIDGLTGQFSNTFSQAAGETGLFWQDLVISHLIDISGGLGGDDINCSFWRPMTLTPGAYYIGNYMPPAKIGYGNFFYVYEQNGQNWFGLSTITAVNSTNGIMTSSTAIPVSQAYNIDLKVDDGMPTTGRVQAMYINGNSTSPASLAPNASSDSSTTCYNSTTNSYSISQSSGNGANCALSFRMQAGD